jgi:hypothetical protein
MLHFLALALNMKQKIQDQVLVLQSMGFVDNKKNTKHENI